MIKTTSLSSCFSGCNSRAPNNINFLVVSVLFLVFRYVYSKLHVHFYSFLVSTFYNTLAPHCFFNFLFSQAHSFLCCLFYSFNFVFLVIYAWNNSTLLCQCNRTSLPIAHVFLCYSTCLLLLLRS